MSISDKILRLQNAKKAQAEALTEKGVNVPEGAGFEDFPKLIEGITSGVRYEQLAQVMSKTAEHIDWPGVTKILQISRLFASSQTLITLSLPDLEYVDGAYFCASCPSLTSVNLPTLKSINSGQMFENCSLLTYLRFPKLYRPGGNALFRGCISLKTIDYAEEEYIDAFNNSHIIGINDFCDCSSLSTLILRHKTKMWRLSNVNSFTNTPIEDGTGYIYVPRALLSDEDATMDYRRATNWITFAEQFRAIEDYPEICGGAEE